MKTKTVLWPLMLFALTAGRARAQTSDAPADAGQVQDAALDAARSDAAGGHAGGAKDAGPPPPIHFFFNDSPGCAVGGGGSRGGGLFAIGLTVCALARRRRRGPVAGRG